MLGRRRRKQPDPAPEELPAVGWDAITAALEGVYGDIEPIHRAPVAGPALGGGVQGISAYAAEGHWHLVTYGLTELYEKKSDDLDRSGWGYELTIRVAAGSREPPPWAFELLERVARQTQRNATVFAPGHRIDAGSPIDGAESPCTGLAFALDPQLGTIDTPHGRVDFLQLVAITSQELAEMKATTTAHVLARLAVGNPLLVTDDRTDQRP